MCAAASSLAGWSGADTYSAYGLGLRSVIPLPAPLSHDGAVDAEVCFAALPTIMAALNGDEGLTRVTSEETQLLLPGVGTFVIRNGGEVLVDPAPETEDVLLQLAMVGPVIAALLQQRGWLVLHASAVEIAGNAVGFLGVSSAGKSTMAAALHGRGHRVLADDILPVRLEEGEPRVYAGFPQLKLCPDAAEAFGGDVARLPPLHRTYPKRAQRIAGQQSSAGLPLACLYLLCGGEQVAIEPLTPPEAFLQLVSHSYGIGWLHGVSGAAQFQDRAALAGRIPVRRLRRPRELRGISELARTIEADRDHA